MKLYQDCSLLVRIWRRRYYLPIPLMALIMWIRSRQEENDVELKLLFRDCWLSFRDCWTINKERAQIKMKWVYPIKNLRKN